MSSRNDGDVAGDCRLKGDADVIKANKEAESANLQEAQKIEPIKKVELLNTTGKANRVAASIDRSFIDKMLEHLDNWEQHRVENPFYYAKTKERIDKSTESLLHFMSPPYTLEKEYPRLRKIFQTITDTKLLSITLHKMQSAEKNVTIGGSIWEHVQRIKDNKPTVDSFLMEKAQKKKKVGKGNKTT